MSIEIIKQPMDVYALIGAAISVSVVAVGDDLKYRWQVKQSGADWRNSSSSGATTDTISMTMSNAWNNCGLRCNITDASGNTITSEEVIVYIGSLVTSFTLPNDTKKYPIRDATAITQNDLNSATYDCVKQTLIVQDMSAGTVDDTALEFSADDFTFFKMFRSYTVSGVRRTSNTLIDVSWWKNQTSWKPFTDGQQQMYVKYENGKFYAKMYSYPETITIWGVK